MTSNARHSEHTRLVSFDQTSLKAKEPVAPSAKHKSRPVTWIVAACACLTAFAVKISQQWLLWADQPDAYADLITTFDWAAIVLCICALALVAIQSLPDAPVAHTPSKIETTPPTQVNVEPNIALPRADDNRLRLAQSLSHELRTPLNAVIGFSDLMNHELHGNLGHPKYNEYCAHITASSQSLLRAVDDILALNADHDTASQNRVPMPVAQALTTAWENNTTSTTATATEQPSLLEITGDKSSQVVADPDMLAHALANLVDTLKRHAVSNSTISATIEHRNGATQICCSTRIDQARLVETAPLVTGTSRTGDVQRMSRDTLTEVAAKTLVQNMGGQLTVRQHEGTSHLEIICVLPAPTNENTPYVT